MISHNRNEIYVFLRKQFRFYVFIGFGVTFYKEFKNRKKNSKFQPFLGEKGFFRSKQLFLQILQTTPLLELLSLSRLKFNPFFKKKFRFMYNYVQLWQRVEKLNFSETFRMTPQKTRLDKLIIF